MCVQCMCMYCFRALISHTFWSLTLVRILAYIPESRVHPPMKISFPDVGLPTPTSMPLRLLLSCC